MKDTPHIKVDQAHARLLLIAELQLKRVIRRFFDDMEDGEKRRYKLLPYDAEVPQSQSERDIYHEQFAWSVIRDMSGCPIKRAHVIGRLKSVGIAVSETTPVHLLHTAIIAILRKMDPQHLLEAGVYGHGHTISDADKCREYCVNESYKAIINRLVKEN